MGALPTQHPHFQIQTMRTRKVKRLVHCPFRIRGDISRPPVQSFVNKLENSAQGVEGREVSSVLERTIPLRAVLGAQASSRSAHLT